MVAPTPTAAETEDCSELGRRTEHEATSFESSKARFGGARRWQPLHPPSIRKSAGFHDGEDYGSERQSGPTTDALDEIRRDAWNEAGKAGQTQLAKDLKGARFALWKNSENLTERQQLKLARIQKLNQRLHRANLLAQQLRQIYRLPAEHARSGAPITGPSRSPRPTGSAHRVAPSNHRRVRPPDTGDGEPGGGHPPTFEVRRSRRSKAE